MGRKSRAKISVWAGEAATEAPEGATTAQRGKVLHLNLSRTITVRAYLFKRLFNLGTHTHYVAGAETIPS